MCTVPLQLFPSAAPRQLKCIHLGLHHTPAAIHLTGMRVLCRLQAVEQAMDDVIPAQTS